MNQLCCFLLAICLTVSCGAESVEEVQQTECLVNEARSCVCPNDIVTEQVCADGTFDECVCEVTFKCASDVDCLSDQLCFDGACLPDVDGDLVVDSIDICPNIPNPGQVDRDMDGVGDRCDDSDNDGVFDSTDNCVRQSNPDQKDIDRDGVGDVCDIQNVDLFTISGFGDIDMDAIPDAKDNCPFSPNARQADANADGIGDVCDIDSDAILNDDDNCPMTSNSIQADSNNDGIGDACDGDSDTVLDRADNCPTLFNPRQDDLNSDNIGDACDGDSDGVLNAVDNCPLTFNPNQGDINTDGIGDACDVDSDGVLDAIDNCPTTFNPNQSDIDTDGIGDFCDVPDPLTTAEAEAIISQLVTSSFNGGSMPGGYGELRLERESDGRVFTVTNLVSPGFRYSTSSTSKPITAAIALHQIGKSFAKVGGGFGTLTLDTRISDVIPGWTATGIQLGATLRHALSFTSGFNTAICRNSIDWSTFSACVKTLPTLNNPVVPGTIHRYSTSHLDVAGLMAVIVGGYADWKECAQAFFAQSGLFGGVTYPSGLFTPSEILNVTTEEMIEFWRAIKEQTILTPAVCAEIFSDQIPLLTQRTEAADWHEDDWSPAWNDPGPLLENWHFGLGCWIESRSKPFSTVAAGKRVSTFGIGGQYVFYDTDGYYFAASITFVGSTAIYLSRHLEDVLKQWAQATL